LKKLLGPDDLGYRDSGKKYIASTSSHDVTDKGWRADTRLVNNNAGCFSLPKDYPAGKMIHHKNQHKQTFSGHTFQAIIISQLVD
jgi:hypothetical protein